MSSELISSRHAIEQIQKPLDPTDMNVISGFMRLAAGPESVKLYVELKRHIESYADSEEGNSALFVSRSMMMNYGLLEPKREIVGFAATRLKTTEQETGVHIEGLLVSPSERNYGHGRALGRAVIGFAQDHAASYVQLDRPYTSKAGRKLFESLDFNMSDTEHPRLKLS